MFSPNLTIGQKIQNADIAEVFECSKVGNMRLSKPNQALILISDFTKGNRHDKWIDGVLHFTGFGKKGDQDIHKGQNATLCDSRREGTAIYVFQQLEIGFYTFAGRFELADKPYMDMQPGEDGRDRMAWIFPLKPMHEEEIQKPSHFVFDNMEEYKIKVERIEEDYSKLQASFKKPAKGAKEPTPAQTFVYKAPEKIEIPQDIVGKALIHNAYGPGKVVGVDGAMLIVAFGSKGEKKLGYEVCVRNNLIAVL